MRKFWWVFRFISKGREENIEWIDYNEAVVVSAHGNSHYSKFNATC